MTNARIVLISRGHALSALGLPNAMAVKVFDVIYLSGLLGSFFGSKNGFIGGPTIVWPATVAGVMGASIAT